MIRYFCDNCGNIITDEKLVRYLLEDKDREGNLVVGYYAICSCGNKILIKVEPLIRKE